MVAFISNQIIKAQGNGKGKDKYRAYFVKTRMYSAYRDEVDTVLRTDGYEDCIVEG